MTSQILIQNTFIFRGPRLTNFADIIKIAIMFIKTTITELEPTAPLKKISFFGLNLIKLRLW